MELLGPGFWEDATVLLAEDDEMWSLVVCRFLERNGIKVLNAHDGKQAMELYDRHHGAIDVVLSDIRMPHVDGFQLARINFNRLNLPFVVCTGVDDSRAALDMLDFGVQDYLVKPFDEKRLVSVVKYALVRTRLLDNAARPDEFPGNLDKITLKPRLDNIQHAEAWLDSRIDALVENHSEKHFQRFIHEFLVNAYEHGCLGITELEKSGLIENGNYESELARREALDDKGEIEVRIAVLGRKVAITIADSGAGFDYEKYLNMNAEEIARRLAMPNGRGIIIAARHCDEVRYDRDGSRVTLAKTFS